MHIRRASHPPCNKTQRKSCHRFALVCTAASMGVRTRRGCVCSGCVFLYLLRWWFSLRFQTHTRLWVLMRWVALLVGFRSLLLPFFVLFILIYIFGFCISPFLNILYTPSFSHSTFICLIPSSSLCPYIYSWSLSIFFLHILFLLLFLSIYYISLYFFLPVSSSLYI